MVVYVVEHLNYVVAVFGTEEEAEAFAAKYSNVYNKQKDYEELGYGELNVTPYEIGKYDESEFWWLDDEEIVVPKSAVDIIENP